MDRGRFYRVFVSASWGFTVAVAETQSQGFESALLAGILVGIFVYALLALIDSFHLPEDLDFFLVEVIIGYGGICNMFLMAIVLILNLVLATLSQ